MLATRNATALAIPLLIALTLTVFWQGLSGPYLLDDHAHLPQLAGADGQIDSRDEVLTFVFGLSPLSPTGRPLAMLSFLIDDNAWPSPAHRFKHTNLLIHCLNSLLILALALRLLALVRPNDSENQRNLLALAIASIWALQPFHLSPIMMVVQRMTLLSGTFTLCALLCYLQGRLKQQASLWNRYGWMAAATGFCTLLAIMSKETGTMLASFLLALELTLLGHIAPARPKFWALWATAFIAVPLLSLAGYTAYTLDLMDQLFAKRNFDAWERLLTQSRVVLDYTNGILIPGLSSSGPYRDDYGVSRSLLQPLSTLFACLAIALALTVSLVKRRSWPLAAFGILWFLGGHLLESTALPLELYFEHRNYIPMFGLQFAMVCLAANLAEKFNLQKILALTGILYIGLQAAITYQASIVWGIKILIGPTWAIEHPGSPRAQFDAISIYLAMDETEKAKQHYNALKAHRPDDASVLLLGYVRDQCAKDKTENTFNVSFEELHNKLPQSVFSHATLTLITTYIDNIKTGRCQGSYSEVRSLIQQTLRNTRYTKPANIHYNFHILLARMNIRERKLNEAMKSLDDAYAAMTNYEARLMQTHLLMSAGLLDDAERYLALAEKTTTLNYYDGPTKRAGIASTRKQLELLQQWAATQSQNQPAPPPLPD